MNEEARKFSRKLMRECQKYHPHVAIEALVLTLADCFIMQIPAAGHADAIENLARNVRDIIAMSPTLEELRAAAKEGK